jgi:hypothetical protein
MEIGAWMSVFVPAFGVRSIGLEEQQAVHDMVLTKYSVRISAWAQAQENPERQRSPDRGISI